MANALWKGIDVSAYQTNVDYKKVKESGYDFVIIRAGYGRLESQKDSEFEKHYKNAKAAGLYVGAYWYNYANCPSDALTEAKVCAKVISGKQFEMPIYYDIEEQSVMSTGRSNVDSIATTFCNYMESQGYFCGIYGGQYLAESLLTANTRERYAFWYAAYLINPPYKGQYGIWQFSVAGTDARNNPAGVKSVPGVSGQCDMDYCYIDYPSIIKQKGLNGFPKSSPDKPKFTVQIITEFKPRLVIPEYGNKYYNTVSTGGYSTAIIGNPTKSGLNTLANCVGYAAGRFNEIISQGKWMCLTYPPNAEDFYDKAVSEGLEVSNNPSIGAIIVWAKGKTHTGSDGAGHVAVVEQVNTDGSIVTSESGYGCSNPFWTSKRYNNDGRWGAGNSYTFLGFIKNPAIDSTTKILNSDTQPSGKNIDKNPYKEPTTLLKEGSEGEGVKWLQWCLTYCGYYNDPIDGKFQLITLGSVLAFQKKHGLTIDGIVGDATKNALKKEIK